MQLPHGHPPAEPIEQVLRRLQQQVPDATNRQRRQQQQRPRSAAQLSRTPLQSAWPAHQPRPRSAAATRAGRRAAAAVSGVSGGRISTSELRAGGPREQRAERRLRRERAAQYDAVGCAARYTRAQRSFSTTREPCRAAPPNPSRDRQAKAASRVAELMFQQTEARAILQLQRCWRARAARQVAKHLRQTANVIRSVKRKIDEVSLELSQVFRQLDADRSGSVDYAELRDGLVTLGVEPLTDEEFDKFVELVDRDGDGSIDRAEIAALLEYDVLSSVDAFGAMSALRSIGGFRILGLPQGFQDYEASFVPDPQNPTSGGCPHYRNPHGCHLYMGKDGCWALNDDFTPEKVMKMTGYLRKSEADKAKLLLGVMEWSPKSKRPSVWRCRVADTYYDVTLTFRYEAVGAPKKRPSGGSNASSAALSFFAESMALTRNPTGRACWQDRPERALSPSPAPTGATRLSAAGVDEAVKPSRRPPKEWWHRAKQGGLTRPRRGRTDGPRGREAILIRAR